MDAWWQETHAPQDPSVLSAVLLSDAFQHLLYQLLCHNKPCLESWWVAASRWGFTATGKGTVGKSCQYLFGCSHIPVEQASLEGQKWPGSSATHLPEGYRCKVVLRDAVASQWLEGGRCDMMKSSLCITVSIHVEGLLCCGWVRPTPLGTPGAAALSQWLWPKVTISSPSQWCWWWWKRWWPDVLSTLSFGAVDEKIFEEEETSAGRRRTWSCHSIRAGLAGWRKLGLFPARAF